MNFWNIVECKEEGNRINIVGVGRTKKSILFCCIEKITIEEALKKAADCNESYTISIVNRDTCYSISIEITELGYYSIYQDMYNKLIVMPFVRAEDPVPFLPVCRKINFGLPTVVYMQLIGQIMANP